MNVSSYELLGEVQRQRSHFACPQRLMYDGKILFDKTLHLLRLHLDLMTQKLYCASSWVESLSQRLRERWHISSFTLISRWPWYVRRVPLGNPHQHNTYSSPSLQAICIPLVTILFSFVHYIIDYMHHSTMLTPASINIAWLLPPHMCRLGILIL